MGFLDRIRAWLKGETPRRKAPSKSTSAASKVSTQELEDFISSRDGVEAYIEPKTAIYSTTLLVVAADGEYLRRPVRDRGQAGELCEERDVPLYDAAKVGYPRRMRDYDQGIKREQVSLDELPPWPGEDAAEDTGPETDRDTGLGETDRDAEDHAGDDRTGDDG